MNSLPPVLKKSFDSGEERMGGTGNRKDARDIVVGGFEAKLKGSEQLVPTSGL